MPVFDYKAAFSVVTFRVQHLSLMVFIESEARCQPAELLVGDGSKEFTLLDEVCHFFIGRVELYFFSHSGILL